MASWTSSLASLLTTICVMLGYLQAAEAACPTGTSIQPAWAPLGLQVDYSIGGCIISSSGSNVSFTVKVTGSDPSLAYVLFVGGTPKCSRVLAAGGSFLSPVSQSFTGTCGDTVYTLGVKLTTSADYGQVNETFYNECKSAGVVLGTSYPPVFSTSPGCKTFTLKTFTLNCGSATNVGQICNNVVSDVCDDVDIWTSACTCTDAFKTSTVMCKAKNGDCDVPEYCTGFSKTCPDDKFEPSTKVCRDIQAKSSDGISCDIPENCTGTGPACPDDSRLPAGAVCRKVAGPCDVAEYCTASSLACPENSFEGSATVCREQMNSCDAPEYCTGYTANCPEDICKAEAKAKPDENFMCKA